MEIIVIKSTYPNINEANISIKNLLNKNLISSANSFPIKSTSKWTGEIKEVDEIIVFFKTTKENWDKTKEEIKKTHPYKVPCIIKFNVETNESYKNWVKEKTSNPNF